MYIYIYYINVIRNPCMVLGEVWNIMVSLGSTKAYCSGCGYFSCVANK